jgi:hypothetical protein
LDEVKLTIGDEEIYQNFLKELTIYDKPEGKNGGW